MLLSYDPNLRLPLWPSAESARKGILSIWDNADIIKVTFNLNSRRKICFFFSEKKGEIYGELQMLGLLIVY